MRFAKIGCLAIICGLIAVFLSGALLPTLLGEASTRAENTNRMIYILGAAIPFLIAYRLKIGNWFSNLSKGTKPSQKAHEEAVSPKTEGRSLAEQKAVESRVDNELAALNAHFGQAPRPETNSIVILREDRTLVDLSNQGDSWLGGLPTLGEIEWPRDSKGKPFHHLAQLNMSAANEYPPFTSWPKLGSLAFFADLNFSDARDANWCRVVHISDATGLEPTPPPKDIRPIYGTEALYHFKGRVVDDFPATFQRWPVQLNPMSASVSDQEVWEQEIERGFPPKSRYHLDISTFNGLDGTWESPKFWDCARMFAASVENAIHFHAQRENGSSLEGPVGPDVDATMLTLQELSEEISRWVNDFPPWQEMTEEESLRLKGYVDRLHFNVVMDEKNSKPLAELYNRSPSAFLGLRDLCNHAFLKMLNAENAVFELLPPAVQSSAGQRLRRPPACHDHYMLGQPMQIQDAAEWNFHKLALANFNYDQVMNWRFGDVGVLQFWIAPEDLVSANFDRVEATFEAH